MKPELENELSNIRGLKTIIKDIRRRLAHYERELAESHQKVYALSLYVGSNVEIIRGKYKGKVGDVIQIEDDPHSNPIYVRVFCTGTDEMRHWVGMFKEEDLLKRYQSGLTPREMKNGK